MIKNLHKSLTFQRFYWTSKDNKYTFEKLGNTYILGKNGKAINLPKGLGKKFWHKLECRNNKDIAERYQELGNKIRAGMLQY